MKDYRIIFSKTGALIYISHLDLNHSFIRALHRANLPIKCTEGFNKHPKVVFALPLSVGMAGTNEMVDISLTTDDFSNEQLKEVLNSVLPRDIRVKDVISQDLKLKTIQSADYKITFFNSLNISEKIRIFFKKTPLIITKTNKNGEKEVDVTDQVLDFSLSEVGNDTILNIRLSASSESYLNPENIVAAIIKEEFFKGEEYYISREKINF